MSERCICTALRQAAAQSTGFYDDALAPSGIKVTMFRLLRHIDVSQPVSITELAEIVRLDRSTLGRNLRVLEKQSLVAFGIGEDGRARNVSLTKPGRNALRTAEPLWRAAQKDYADLIGADALAVLNRLAKPSSALSDSAGDTP